MSTTNALQTISATPECSTAKRTYTVAEVANHLQISKSKAYELCREGHFKTVKIGSSVRVSKSSFDEWLEK